MTPHKNIHPIKAGLEAMGDHQHEEPRPLVRDITEAAPYPLEALGALEAGARAIVAHSRAPEAIAGQSALAAAALAVQGHADALNPASDQRTPLSIFALTIAESGERKTQVDALALKPVVEREAKLAAEADAAEVQLALDRSVYEAKKAGLEAELKKKIDNVSCEADLRGLGPPPDPPLTPILICNDPTYEGYVRLTAGGQPSMGLFSDEGGSFIGGYGMGPDQRLKTASGLSDLWNGKPIKRVRASEGSYALDGRRLSVHLMAQPAIAWKMLGDDELAEQGLLSRFLVVAPKSTMGTRLFEAPSSDAQEDLRAYHARLGMLLDAPPPLLEGRRNSLDPRALAFEPRAQDLAILFHDEIEREMGAEGRLAGIRGFAAKALEHAVRIAGVLTLADHLEAPHVGSDALDGGVALTRHFITELARLREAAAIPAELAEAQKLLDWLKRTWPEPYVYLTPIYKSGPLRSLRSKKDALRAVSLLEDHGYLIGLADGAVIDGKHRRQAWGIYGRANFI